jgi:NAD(P)H-dependent flavin oxidoreductase YrpB (nitropropane dioxygenase family)
MILCAGQGVRLIMEIIPAGEVVKRLVAEAKLAVRNKKTLFDHQ